MRRCHVTDERVIDWSAIRYDYEQGMSLRQLAAKYGVSKSAIGQRKYDEKWPAHRVDKPIAENPKSNTRNVNAAVQVQIALKILLEERVTWDEVAARAGYASRGAAHNAVMRELQRCITHDVKALRDQELYMLQQLQARCYKAAMDEGNTGWTWAVDRFAVLSKRKSELMGMDVRPDEIAPGTTIIREYGVEVSRV